MNNKIILKAEFLHPSEDIASHPELGRFKDTIQFSSAFEIGTYCLYAESQTQLKLLSFSSNDGIFYQLNRKQHLLNSLVELDSLTLAQYSALISIITRNEGAFEKLNNPIVNVDPILEELTHQTFGWLLWSWQIMGLISYYLPTIEPNIFFIHLSQGEKAVYRLLNDTKVNSELTLYELVEHHSLGIQYTIPCYYFGGQLKQLIQ